MTVSEAQVPSTDKVISFLVGTTFSPKLEQSLGMGCRMMGMWMEVGMWIEVGVGEGGGGGCECCQPMRAGCLELMDVSCVR